MHGENHARNASSELVLASWGARTSSLQYFHKELQYQFSSLYPSKKYYIDTAVSPEINIPAF